MSWIKSRRIDLWPYSRGTPAPIITASPETRIFVLQPGYPLGHPLPSFWCPPTPVNPVATPINRSIMLRQEQPAPLPAPRFSFAAGAQSFTLPAVTRTLLIKQEYPLDRMTQPGAFNWRQPTNPIPVSATTQTIMARQQIPADALTQPVLTMWSTYGTPRLPGQGLFVKQELPERSRPEPMMRGGVVGSAGTWTTIWSRAYTVSDVGWAGYTQVMVIPLAELSDTGGTQIRLTVQGGPTEGFETSGLWVGNGGGAETIDFTGDQVQLTRLSSTTITAPADTEVITDNGIAFVKDGVNPIVISWQCANASADNQYRKSDAGETSTQWYRNAIEASTQNKDQTLYTDNTTFGPRYVTKIEVLK